MTTIVYDGNVLAADSKTTIVSDNFSNLHCSNCGESIDKAIQYTSKLELLTTECLFKDEGIVAFAWAGRQRATDRIKAYVLGRRTTAFTKDDEGGRLIVLTYVNCWELIIDNGVLMAKVITELPYAAGSGSKAALVAMRFMNADAVAAINVAAEVDSSTGGDVHWVTRESKAVEVVSSNK